MFLQERALCETSYRTEHPSARVWAQWMGTIVFYLRIHGVVLQSVIISFVAHVNVLVFVFVYVYIYIYIYIYMYVHFFQTPRAHAIVRSCAALLSCHFEEFQGVRVVRMDDFWWRTRCLALLRQSRSGKNFPEACAVFSGGGLGYPRESNAVYSTIKMNVLL